MHQWVIGILCVLIGPAAWAADPIGDKVRGAEVFDKCTACHQVGPEARDGIGPNLNRIFGRKAGSVPGFAYSRAMQRASRDGLVWDLRRLDAYLENPRALVTGTRMSFAGLPDPQDRADLLAWLRGFSDSPSNIPEAQPTASATDHTVDPAILALQGDPDYGEYLSSECVTCHRADGSDEGIPSITQWPVDDFVTVLHAYKVKLRPHPVMQMIAGRLSDEEIAALAAYFNGLQP